jgi:hypothetical protein
VTSQIRVIAESRTLVDVSIGGIMYRGCRLNTPLAARRRLRHRGTAQSKITVGRVSTLTRPGWAVGSEVRREPAVIVVRVVLRPDLAQADESATLDASLRLSATV